MHNAQRLYSSLDFFQTTNLCSYFFCALNLLMKAIAQNIRKANFCGLSKTIIANKVTSHILSSRYCCVDVDQY